MVSSQLNRLNFVRKSLKIRINLLKSGWFFELLDIRNLLFGANFIERVKVEKNSHSTFILKQPPKVFYKKGFFKSFVKFTGKSQSCSFIRKDTLAQVFSYEFYEMFKNTFFTEHLQMSASFLFLRNFDSGDFYKIPGLPELS